MQSLGPETIVTILGQRVTNTLAATLLVDVVIILLVILIRRKLSLVPGPLQGMTEAFVGFLQKTTEQVAGDRTTVIFPWVAVFFIYIGVSNLAGLLPGFGTVGFFRGGKLVPLLHASTSDLNTTLALAVVSVVASHVMSIRANGLGGYVKRLIARRPPVPGPFRRVRGGGVLHAQG
jgi:F-type H+-transporting ATPase subunit a